MYNTVTKHFSVYSTLVLSKVLSIYHLIGEVGCFLSFLGKDGP